MDPERPAAPADPFLAVDEREREYRLRAVPPPVPATAGDWTIDAADVPTEPGLWPGVEGATGLSVRLRTHATGGGHPDESELLAGERIRRAIGHQCVLGVRRSARAADGRLVLVEDAPRGRHLAAAFQDLKHGRPPGCLATMAGRLAVAVRLSEIVARAHAAGVIHGALAPDVVMVTDDGEVFVDGWPPGCPADLRTSMARWAFGTAHYQAPESARGESATAAGDVYAVAAIAHHLLVGRPPLISTTGTQSWLRKTQGVTDPLTEAERTHVPDAIAAALGQGLIGQVDLRPEAGAFAETLQRAADTCLVAAQGRPTGRRWPWWVVVALVVLAGVGLAWMRYGPVGRWDGPTLAETFAEPSWPTRWRTLEGHFERVPLGVGTVAGTGHILACEQRMSPHVAVEFEARMAPGAAAGDLSFKWLPTLNPGADGKPAPVGGPGVINVQIGAYDNRYALIEYGNRIAQAHLTLDPGRIYRVRIELDGDRIDLELDGHPLLSATTLFPLPSGHPALYGYYGGKEFGNVRVRSQSPRTTVSPLAVGDAFFSDGLWASAQLRYREVALAHAGTPLGEAAQFRLGLSRLRDGDVAAAGRAWQSLTGGLWQPRIDITMAKHMLEAGEWQQVQRITETVLARSPELRPQALELWTADVDRRTRELQYGDADHLEQTWRTLLDGDRLAGDVVQRMLLAAGHHERVLADPESAAYAQALTAVGRTDEVMRRFPHDRRAMIGVLLQRGEFERLLVEIPEQQWAVAIALNYLDRLDDIPRLAPLEETLMHSLRGEFSNDTDTRAEPAYRMRALLTQERFAEAEVVARDLQLNSATVGLHADLACALGRSAEFAAMMRLRGASSLVNEADQAFAVIATGDVSNGQRIIDAYMARPNIPEVCDKPFEVCVLPAWAILRVKGGDAARAFLGRVVEQRRHQQGQRTWHIAALALGRIDAGAFRTQPMRIGLAGDEELAVALAAELAGDKPAALAHYRAWNAIPPLRRSVSNPSLVSRFVTQRMGELSAPPQ